MIKLRPNKLFKSSSLFLGILLIGFCCALGSADAAPPAKKKTRIIYEAETTIRFEDSVIEGKIIKPDGFFLLRKRPKRWQDLIKVRENFDPEMTEMKYQF